MNSISVKEQFEWVFPGGTAALIQVAVFAFILIVASYFYTLRKPGNFIRMLLILFRVTVIAILLYCLCGPAIERTMIENKKKESRTAVIFDESGGMCVPSYGGKSRRDKAVAYWEKTVEELVQSGSFDYYAFSESLREIDSPAEVMRSPNKKRTTNLLKSVKEWTPKLAAQGIDRVICFSDGIDTSDETLETAAAALQRSWLPHVFVPLTDRIPGNFSASFLKVEADSNSQLHTDVPVRIVANIDERLGSEVQLVVRNNQGPLLSRNLKAVSNTMTNIEFTVPVTKEGSNSFVAVLLRGNQLLDRTSWSVFGVKKAKLTTRILLYQGALDWGTRYLRDVLDKDEMIDFFVRYCPGVYAGIEKDKQPVWNEYDVVILFNMNRYQIDQRMVTELKSFVGNGGALLFLSANKAAAGEFAASPLEELLPVIFNDSDLMVDHLMNKVKSIQHASKENNYKLTRMILTKEGMRSPIFDYAKTDDGRIITDFLPAFAECAPVKRCKAGAFPLAIHPEFSGKDGVGTLLAYQQYGAGGTAVLTTDALWRWRLSISSTSRIHAEFWKRLLRRLATTSKRETEYPYWEYASSHIPPKRDVEIHFRIPEAEGPKLSDYRFIYTVADGKRVSIDMKEDPEQRGYCSGTVYIAKDQTAKIKALVQGKIICENLLSTGKTVDTELEMSMTKPDLHSLTALASASGGFIVHTGQEFNWNDWLSIREENVVRKKRSELWQQPWILCAILLIYSTELILRRVNRMV